MMQKMFTPLNASRCSVFTIWSDRAPISSRKAAQVLDQIPSNAPRPPHSTRMHPPLHTHTHTHKHTDVFLRTFIRYKLLTSLAFWLVLAVNQPPPPLKENQKHYNHFSACCHLYCFGRLKLVLRWANKCLPWLKEAPLWAATNSRFKTESCRHKAGHSWQDSVMQKDTVAAGHVWKDIPNL